jgi:hypothetical protein
MIKRVATYLLPEGADGEKIWTYHTRVYAPAFIEAVGPALRKWVFNKLTRVVSGEQKFFVLSELWWESEEAMNRAIEKVKVTRAPSGRMFFDDIKSQVTQNFVGVVEEFVAKE